MTMFDSTTMIKTQEFELAEKGLKLDRVVFYGRALSEYKKFFDLDIRALRGKKTLDIAAGASSFTAEACVKGVDAIALDPLYGEDLDVLLKRGEQDIDHVMSEVVQAPELFNWSFYATVDQLRECRAESLRLFAEDYPLGLMEGRYVKGAAPNLPFADDSFDMALCGHFLFIYSDRLDYDFHRDSIVEALRVSGEMRIYPLTGLDANPRDFLTDLLSDLERENISGQIARVPWGFLKNSDHMLRLTRK